ncbi:MAG: hypothetical protein ACLR23_02895 [Clostridia bacterium]
MTSFRISEKMMGAVKPNTRFNPLRTSVLRNSLVKVLDVMKSVKCLRPTHWVLPSKDKIGLPGTKS